MILPDLLSASAQSIIDYYGLPKQLNQLMEECGELIAASNHYIRKCETGDKAMIHQAKANLENEIIDVIVILDQILERIGTKEEAMRFLANYKIDRQLQRIKRNE